MKSVLWLCFSLLLVTSTIGFPMYLTNTHCYKKMAPGEIMMGQSIVRADDVNVQVWRTTSEGGEIQLSSGDTYAPGEELVVKVSSSISGAPVRQYVLEAQNSVFQEGKCGGTRIENGKPAKLRVPRTFNDNSLKNEEKQEEELGKYQQVITVTAVWAKKYGQVFLTQPFLLQPPLHDSEEL